MALAIDRIFPTKLIPLPNLSYDGVRTTLITASAVEVTIRPGAYARVVIAAWFPGVTYASGQVSAHAPKLRPGSR
ncbi:hypothetical protein MAUB_30200 [Mycolicibacterium aubagnense]|uniref:Uncharacterized protein n=1 Tax=Mycolicibacterium aubagnense TaxID=319707 RepID=A0ABM7IEJ1_9MYCO|nr:hypothetical protein MAUB_30200 [Mycolicibacterium aubagnense]